MKKIIRSVTLLLVLSLLLGFTACSQVSEEIPAGMKLATAAGSDFRLYIPSSWNSNTAYGVSGGCATLSEQSNVSMTKHVISAETEALIQADVQAQKEAEAANPETTDGTDRTGEWRIDWFWRNECLPALEGIALGGSLAEADAKSQDLLNKLNAWRYHWTGIANGTDLHFLQVIAEKDGAFYLFSFTATNGQYSSQLHNVEAMLDSFIFADPYYPDDYVKQIDGNITPPAGMKLASNKDVAYNFFVPEAWTVNRDEAIFAAYLESDLSSVSVVPYMPDVNSMSVKEFYALCEKLMKETAGEDGYELISVTENMDLGGRVATSYVYRYTVGGVEYRYQQVIAAYKSMIYSLTYTAKPECFDAHLSDVAAMIDAFQFR